MRALLRSAVAVLLLALPSTALAASLPRVSSGARPGPAVLYERPSAAPQLSLRAPFRAAPLLVSGTDALRRGEYLYQDFLFDDRGADTVPGAGRQRDSGGRFSFSAGDVQYPSDERYAQNAADFVEVRVTRTRDHVVYRVTLNTVKAADATIVGIGIDTDRSGGAAVAWPGGAGISSPGLDAFVLAWGTGGKLLTRPGGDPALSTETPLGPGAVTISRHTNQMTNRSRPG